MAQNYSKEIKTDRFLVRGLPAQGMMMTTYLIFEIVEPLLCLAFLIFQLFQCGRQGVQFALFGINWRRLASDKFCNIL